MGVSRLTAMIVATRDDLTVAAGGPDEQGKYAGFILMPSGRPLLSTGAEYGTAEAAESGMSQTVDEIRAFMARDGCPGVIGHDDPSTDAKAGECQTLLLMT